jgi:hypothetical protein
MWAVVKIRGCEPGLSVRALQKVQCGPLGPYQDKFLGGARTMSSLLLQCYYFCYFMWYSHKFTTFFVWQF